MVSNPCRAAVLDIGSQTFRMAGAEVRGTCADVLFSKRKNVRLAEGLREKGRIGTQALERAMSTLETFSRILKRHSITRVRAVGTAALRQAVNADVLLEHAAALGFSIETIDWQEEAALSAAGASAALGNLESSWAMIDVGGGSSEVVFCYHRDIIKAVSLEIGAVSLLDMVPGGNTPNVGLLRETAARFIARRLSCMLSGFERPKTAVGTGGTATTVAAVEAGIDVYDPGIVRGRIVTLSDLGELLSRMCRMDLGQRQGVKGLEPERADIFPAGIAILAEIVSCLKLDEITISDGGLLSGLLIAFLEKECDLNVESSCARSLYL